MSSYYKSWKIQRFAENNIYIVTQTSSPSFDQSPGALMETKSYTQSMCTMSFIFVIVCRLFEWKLFYSGFLISSVCSYLYCRWRSNYISRWGWHPINWINSAIFVCLSHTRIWISICRDLFCVQGFEMSLSCLFCTFWLNCWPSLMTFLLLF
jgi:hypothetical protein